MVTCDSMSLSEKFLSIRNQVPPNVKILFACKYATDEQIKELLTFDNLMFGENYVQSAQKRKTKIPRERYHFIGHLQRNKVREALQHFGTIQTVDSKELADKISKVANELGVKVNVYIQVNLDNNPSQSGIDGRDLFEIVKHVAHLPNLKLIGLLSMGTQKENKREIFSQLKKLAMLLSLKTSMGMSEDYKIAIEAGSDMVRLGRIFL